MAKGNRIQIGGRVDDFQTKKKEIDKFLSRILRYKKVTDEQKEW